MAPERPPEGTITFLFSDIEGSTRLWESYPDLMRVSLARHDALMREAIQSSGGFVFKTVGDAFCAAFPTAGEGVRGALAAQLALGAEAWPHETPIKVRIALHTGAVESRDSDYFGPPVNRVARVLGIGHGGQSLLSQATFELVRDSLPEEITTKDLGPHQLKDLGRPEHVFQLVHPSLSADFPPLRSLSNHPNNLPLQLTSFVGREEEIDFVKASLSTSRLVTLTGSGGAGKTRLAIQVGAELLERFPDGVWFIELATVNEEEAVARTVGKPLGIADDRERNLAEVIAAKLRPQTTLIVLDNCEHLVAGCAILADNLLRSCQNLKILATSREALAIGGESAIRVPPLGLPDRNAAHSVQTLNQFAAVRLFIDRAAQVDSSFAVTNENAPALAAICCRLDGIPLAIELAAARTRGLSVEQIETRLDKRFSLLTSGSRVALPRQQTLRALIDWSYDLLQPSEKEVLQRLSAFAGTWDSHAAEAVASDGGLEAFEVQDSLLSLVEKNLVAVHATKGTNRYSLLESIREYAHEKLTESGYLAAIEDRHFAYFQEFASDAGAALRGPEQKAWSERLDADHDNIRAALSRGIANGGSLSMVVSLWWYWYSRGHLTEGRKWLSVALEKSGCADMRLRAQALNGAGVLAEYTGDWQAAIDQLTESANLFRSLDEKWQLAKALNNMGNVYGSTSDFAEAERMWREALEIWKVLESNGELADATGLAATVDNLGNLAVEKGLYEEARGLYAEGFHLRIEAGDPALAAYSLVNMGYLEMKVGDKSSALNHLSRGLQMSLDHGDNFAIPYFLFGLATLAKPDVAATLLGSDEGLREKFGIARSHVESDEHLSAVYAVRQELGESFDELWARGRSLELNEAADLALQVRLD